MIREKIHATIEEDISNSMLHKLFEGFIVVLITLNVLAIIVSASLKNESALLRDFEVFSVAVFSVEYLLRLLTADIKFGNVSGFKATPFYIFADGDYRPAVHTAFLSGAVHACSSGRQGTSGAEAPQAAKDLEAYALSGFLHCH
jgi:hypothetical protein